MYMVRELLQESLLSVYLNESLSEGSEDHPETKTSCVTPEELTRDLNSELARLSVDSKDRVRRKVKDVIYTRRSINKVLDDGELDVDKFKSLITQTPKTIFDQNPKMEKTDIGKAQYTVNTGLPAINGIVYDETEKEFKHINTCPGAGACQLVCYARKGFYGMNDGKVLKLIRRLNLLWNDPDEYEHMVMDELEPQALKLKRQGRRSGEDIQLVIRWNDAGDFFSERYFNIAKSVTKSLLESGYNVKSYAYTKQAKFVDISDDNFITNFSKQANPKELRQIDLEKVKFSDIVPKELFKDIFARKVKGGMPEFAEGGEAKLKQLVSAEYNIPIERLKYQWELPPTEEERFKYDVIVMPSGDSDIGAQRLDVHKTLLLVH